LQGVIVTKVIHFTKFSRGCLLLLILIHCSIAQIGFSGELRVIRVIGSVKESLKRLEIGDLIKDDVFIKSYRDSYAILKGDCYYKIYPYTRVKIDGGLKLLSGKLSKSDKNDFLDLHFYFSPSPAQGKTLRVIIASNAKDPSIKASIYNRKGYTRSLTIYDLSNRGYRILTGFNAEDPPVKYNLNIVLNNQIGDFTEIIYPFYLKRTRFERGKVWLAKEKANLLKPSEKKNQEVEKLKNVLSISNEQALWRGVFIYPLDNPFIISEFGKKRFYYLNGRFKYVRYHRGIDFRGTPGTRVRTPNNGMVAFSGKRITTGYTVVMDHGQGVYSLFFHLSRITVPQGKYVSIGEKIGEVGSTGITAGSHLHWSMLVNGIYIDPIDWTKVSF